MRLLLFLFCLFLPLSVLGLSDGKVLVENLNVRKLPDGELVGQLPKNHPLQIVREESGWSQVVFINEGSEMASHGWVASQFIQPVLEFASTNCIPAPANGTNHCLSTTEPELQCEMEDQSSNFSVCSVEIGYKLFSEEGDLDDLEIVCSVNMRTRSSLSSNWNNWTQTSNARYNEVFEEKTAGNISLHFEFSDKAIVKYFRLAETDCKLVFDDSADQTALLAR